MKFYFILSLSFLSLFTSCINDSTSDNSTSASTDVSQEEIKTQYLREPVDIVSSTGEDYPQTMIDLGFPILPNTEVTNVGNTDIENGTVVMQMETLKNIDEIKEFFDKEMTTKGWEIKDLNIFQGADAAYSYRNKDYTARILVINDKVQDLS